MQQHGSTLNKNEEAFPCFTRHEGQHMRTTFHISRALNMTKYDARCITVVDFFPYLLLAIVSDLVCGNIQSLRTRFSRTLIRMMVSCPPNSVTRNVVVGSNVCVTKFGFPW